MAHKLHSKQQRECLYEILNVPRSADNNELKSAYKQQAKRWHPDKNINNIEAATIRFKQINEAYSILSDKHERAWYDAHRDAILRGIDKEEINVKMKENEDYDPDIDLMPFFSPFCYESFCDEDENCFYNVYNDLFVRIVDLEKLSKKKTPSFGNSTLSFDAMNNFYDFWEIFVSRRSFSWMAKYNLADAENRKMRKLMHKENRRLINEKRKKWEDAILRLVAFIKKRDPRYRNYLNFVEEQRLNEERRMMEYQKEIEQIMKEEQLKQRLLKKMEQQSEQSGNENCEMPIEELFECIVCNKVYKTEKSFIAHKLSKKHVKALENLKFQLKIENDVIFENENDCKVNDQHNVDRLIAKQIAIQEENAQSEEEVAKNENEREKANGIDLDYLLALSVEQEDIMNNAVDLFQDNNSQNNGDDGDGTSNVLITDSEIIALLQQPGIDIDALLNTYSSLTREYILELIRKDRTRNNENHKKWKKNKRKKQRKKRIVVEENDEENVQNMKNAQENDQNEQENEDKLDDLNAFMNKFKKFNKKSDFINKQKYKKSNQQNGNLNDENAENVPKKKRRRRRKNKDAQNQRNMNSNSTSSAKSSASSSCKACNKNFGSKTKLFQHLKQFPKHALRSQHINECKPCN